MVIERSVDRPTDRAVPTGQAATIGLRRVVINERLLPEPYFLEALTASTAFCREAVWVLYQSICSLSLSVAA